MSWSEDDFLEKLMPQLRQERSGSDGACPDASTILAVIDGDADEWLRNAYAQHLAQCSACLELDTRLRNFDRPVLADEAEWRRTEKRLDNWLGALVESRAAAAPPALEKRAARAGFWESIWRPGLAWKLSLAMGLVALVAVGAGVYTKWRVPFWSDQGKVATSTAPTEESSPIPLPAETPHPKSEAPKSTERETPGPSAPLIPGGVMYRGGPMAAAPKPPQVKLQPKPEESATVASKASPSEPQQRAALEPPPAIPAAPGRVTVYRSPATTSGRRPATNTANRGVRAYAIGPHSTTTTASNSPPPQDHSQPVQHSETAEESAPAEPQVQAEVQPPANETQAPPVPHSSSGNVDTRPSNVARGGPQTIAPLQPVAPAPIKPAPSTAPELPSSIRFPAGTRLWIKVQSVSGQRGGRFTFRGSLLLPVTSGKTVLLDGVTEFLGSGTTERSTGASTEYKTSLAIAEIVVQGLHYKLRIADAAMNAQTVGSGAAVRFDSGRVFEMWLSSDSTYEREAAAEPPRQ